MTPRILVLLIEDNRLVRDGLKALLDAQPDCQVVAAAEGASAALTHLKETQPHVVLLDAALGSGDSRLLVEKLKRAAPDCRVIVMDLLPVQDDVIAFIRAGASGFILKDATVDDLVRTIRSVAEGNDVVPPSLTGTLLSHIAEHAILRRTPRVLQAVRLTKREREVAALIAEGLSNKEIGQRLHIATYTVKSHVHTILEKLALHTRLQIAAHTHQRRAETGEATEGASESP